MTTAFVLSGGGSLGAVQVGILQALAAAGIEPDLLIGTSAGGLNRRVDRAATPRRLPGPAAADAARPDRAQPEPLPRGAVG